MQDSTLARRGRNAVRRDGQLLVESHRYARIHVVLEVAYDVG